MENSTIKNDVEPVVEAPIENKQESIATPIEEKKPLHLKKKAKIAFDILILLIAFTGVIISVMFDLDTESFISMLKFTFPMIMYVWVIINRIVDIYKHVN